MRFLNCHEKFEKISIVNCERESFRNKLIAIPYSLYEVEQISNGLCVTIKKPGEKRTFGKPSPNDFQVFLHNSTNKNLLVPPGMLWMPPHEDLFQWVAKCKNDENLDNKDRKKLARFLVWALWRVCKGEEPDYVLMLLQANRHFADILGFFDEAIEIDHSAEIILKLYKWIWGQEDCNYWGGKLKGRLLSMDSLLSKVDWDNSSEAEYFFKKYS